jgi:DNA-binding GntR family transcriptional regulator
MLRHAAPDHTSKNRSRLVEDAYETLKAAITSGELQPGERLYETALSARFGVSRTPVREALQRLVTEGLAAVGPDGVRVTTLSVKDVRALQQTSRALQSLAASLAALEGTEPDMATLEELMQRMEACAAAHDFRSWAEADVAIHRHIFQMSENPWLSRLLLQMESLIARVRHVMLRQPGRVEEATKEHRLVVEAIKSRDGKAAETAMYDHLLMAEKALIETLEAVVVPWRGDRV